MKMPLPADARSVAFTYTTPRLLACDAFYDVMGRDSVGGRGGRLIMLLFLIKTTQQPQPPQQKAAKAGVAARMSCSCVRPST